MKPRSRTAIVGRNLRRYLGALLTVGFGVSWWSFMPLATAATPKPRITQRAPEPAARRVTSVPTLTPKVVEVVPVTIAPPTPQPKKKPRPRKPPKVIPPIVEPQTPIVETPVVEPDTVPVETPVVETPVVATPVVETPVVDPLDDPYLSPIITRSS